MCAGLIPGVNIRTRPRVFFMFVMEAINESSLRVDLALLSSPNVDTKKMHDIAFDRAIPPLSTQVSLEKDIKKMNAIYENIKLRNKKKKK